MPTDVRRRGTRRLAGHQVRGVGRVALGAVDGRGAGELDVFVDVLGRQLTPSCTADDQEAAVVTDALDGPGVAVGDPEVAVVAASGDAVAEADALTTAGHGLTGSLTTWVTSVPALVAYRSVERAHLLTGVGDDERVVGGTHSRECRGAFDLGCVERDRATLVYFLQRGTMFVVLLCGGDKSSQDKDIKQAYALAEEW